MGDLVGASRPGDDGAEAIGRDPRDVQVARTEAFVGGPDDEEHAPRTVRAGDDDGELRSAIGEDRQGEVAVRTGQDDAGQPGAARPRAA